MARRARSKDSCRFCGDVSATCEDTWQPTGLCKAHSAPKAKAAQKATRAARRADRETVTTVERISCPTCEGPLHVSHCTPAVAAARGYQCDGCADIASGLARGY